MGIWSLPNENVKNLIEFFSKKRPYKDKESWDSLVYSFAGDDDLWDEMDDEASKEEFADQDARTCVAEWVRDTVLVMQKEEPSASLNLILKVVKPFTNSEQLTEALNAPVSFKKLPFSSSISKALRKIPNVLVSENYRQPSTRFQNSKIVPWAIQVFSFEQFSVWDVMKALYNQFVKEGKFEVSPLKDTRPGWDSMSFSVKAGDTEFYFSASGFGTNFTPIYIEWRK